MSLLPDGAVGCKSPSFQTILFCSAIHTPAGLESTFPTLPFTGTEIATLERGGGGLEEFVEMCHEACEGQWRATVRVQHREPRAKTTEVETCMTLVCASTNDDRPLTGGTHLIWTVVDWVALGSGPCINGTHKCQKFSS